MKNKVFIPIVAVLLTVGILAGFLSTRKDKAEDLSEYCDTAYSDIIASIVTGYKIHWEESSPEDMGLSGVYRYESEYGGFARKDINGDGVEELLIGDVFQDGEYQLYDIYTFDKKTNNPVHLLSGGERDSFVINGKGAIIETGSNSAFDSMTRYYVIENAALKDVDSAEEDLMVPEFDKFLRYVAPTAYVAVKDGEVQGRLVKTLEDSYLVEIQDSVNIPKDGVDIQLWSAYDGKGVAFPKNPGSYPVFSQPDEDAGTIGEIIYESGYVPDAFNCLGYTRGWFRIGFEGAEGYLKEEDSDWDFVNRF